MNIKILSIIVCIGVVACSTTVVPTIEIPNSIEIVNGNPTAGLLGFTNQVYLEHQIRVAILDKYAYDKYNALITLYGGLFIPELTPDFEIVGKSEDGLYYLTKSGLERFLTMNIWNGSGMGDHPPSWVGNE